MRSAHQSGRIQIFTHFNHLNRGGSPVFSVADNVAPLLVLLLIGVGLLFISFLAGLLTLLVGTLFYIFALRPWVASRLHNRTVKMMLLNPHNWQVIWQFGGVVVTLKENPRIGCTAPGADWRSLARHFVVERVGPGFGADGAPKE
ncbi:MAG: hypothetical protein ACPGOY_08585 [Rhodospirillaceae bacterium]